MSEIRLNLGNKGHQKPEMDGDVALAPEKVRIKPPPMYKVILLNDDYTPMDFVVDVLEQFFGMAEEKATQTMLMIHTQGKAVCGVYTRDIAETKAEMVNGFSREHNHPLLCKTEQAD
ncbi:ATP-dependent Clp protease adapter ClpS [Endozoicomonadaceae bacterium StTr2]